MKCKKLGSHTISYQSLLLSTIVPNDIKLYFTGVFYYFSVQGHQLMNGWTSGAILLAVPATYVALRRLALRRHTLRHYTPTCCA